jgi:hypothetical protein
VFFAELLYFWLSTKFVALQFAHPITQKNCSIWLMNEKNIENCSMINTCSMMNNSKRSTSDQTLKHLEGRPNSRGGLYCFWSPNKTWTPPLGTSNTLTIIENELYPSSGRI